jgi:DNA-binding transcriptional LysR family regulator
MVDEDLHRGDLVEVLPQYRAAEFGIYAIYPSRQFVSPKIRALIDFISAALNNASWAAPERDQKKWAVNSV